MTVDGGSWRRQCRHEKTETLVFSLSHHFIIFCFKSLWHFGELDLIIKNWGTTLSNSIKIVGWREASTDIIFAILKPTSGYSPAHQPTGYTQADSRYDAGEPEGQISYYASDWAGWAEARWTVIPHLCCLKLWQPHPWMESNARSLSHRDTHK